MESVAVHAETPGVERPEWPRVDKNRSGPNREDPLRLLWVAVCGRTFEEASGPEGRALAINYGASKLGADAGWQRQDGPHPDDGRVAPFQVGGDHQVVASARDWYRLSAANQVAELDPKAARGYVVFHLIGRGDMIAG